MAEINLTDSKGRDAVVSAESVAVTHEFRWVDAAGAQADNRKVLRATAGHDLADLVAACGEDPEDLASALVAGDPEVDLESFGAFLDETSRVYTDPDYNIVYKITLWENVYAPTGELKERRQRGRVDPNVATGTPLRWSGKLMKKGEVYNAFVFASKMQIHHVNGLTYDFLFGMARELEEADSLMLLGAGPKGNQPLVFRRGAIPYRGFLEGRTRGNSYALILHLTNMELKAPPHPDTAPTTNSKPQRHDSHTPTPTGDTSPTANLSSAMSSTGTGTGTTPDKRRPPKKKSAPRMKDAPKAQATPSRKRTSKKKTAPNKQGLKRKSTRAGDAPPPKDDPSSAGDAPPPTNDRRAPSRTPTGRTHLTHPDLTARRHSHHGDP